MVATLYLHNLVNGTKVSGSGGGPIMLNPSIPDSYDGRRHFLIENRWLYKMEQYLELVNELNGKVI